MRFSGQGLMSHTSTTTISRFFEKSRGKALSTIWFGLSSAEFILPVLVTYLFVIYSWRSVWQGIAIIVIIFLPFVVLNTIKQIKLDSREKDLDPKSPMEKEVLQWFKQSSFYLENKKVSKKVASLAIVASAIMNLDEFLTHG